MSPESQKIMFIFLAFVLLGVIVGFSLKMLLSCKSGQVKVGGKCHTVIPQVDPTGLADGAKIIDGKMDTNATKITGTAATVTLNIKDAGATGKKVKGAIITAMAEVPTPASTETKDVVLSTVGATPVTTSAKFKQDGKKYSIGTMFSAEQTASTLTLSVPTGVTVYEVQLV